MIISLVVGLFAMMAYFVPHRSFSQLEQYISQWISVVAATALVLGAVSLFQHHCLRLMKKHPDRMYSVVTLVAMVVTTVLGLVWGIEEGTPFKLIFDTVYKPLTTAMFSLLAFFLASAAFRSFRIRSFEAGLLFAAAIIVMLGRIPVGASISEIIPFVDLPIAAEWILDVPTTAAMRAIQIGVGLGMATLSIKIILGLERTYMG
jgi:hypothetical protein